MGHAVSPEPEKSRKPSYARHWILIALLAAASLLPRLFRAGAAPRPPAGKGADWFLALRLPVLAGSGERERLERRRLGEWLDELGRADFRPVLLSEARARLGRGERLPGKPVVLVIEGGYRRTYEAVAPLLRARRSPSVWIMDGAALARGDERFVSRHAVRGLRGSGLCDAAFFQGSTRTFTLSGETLGWREDAGRSALNRSPAGPLERLNVNFAWTGRQLVERLQAEVPVRGRARLGGQRLFGRLWGVSREASSPPDPFDIQAEPGSRDASLSWKGTAGLRDLRLDLSAAAVSGELWIYVGYDEAVRRGGLRIGFTPVAAVVEDWRGGVRRRVGALSRSAPPGGPLAATVQLYRSRLSVSLDNGPFCDFGLERGPWPSSGTVLLLASDRIRGAARANGVELALTAL